MNPKCPDCGADSWQNGFSRSGRCVHKCKSCGKKFNDRAGTPFWHLKKEEKDVLIMHAMSKHVRSKSLSASDFYSMSLAGFSFSIFTMSALLIPRPSMLRTIHFIPSTYGRVSISPRSEPRTKCSAPTSLTICRANH